jgi:hypothetical protein
VSTGRPKTAIARAVARRRQAEGDGRADDPWSTHNDPMRPNRDKSTGQRIADQIMAGWGRTVRQEHSDPGAPPREGTAGARIAARHGIGRSR